MTVARGHFEQTSATQSASEGERACAQKDKKEDEDEDEGEIEDDLHYREGWRSFVRRLSFLLFLLKQ